MQPNDCLMFPGVYAANRLHVKRWADFGSRTTPEDGSDRGLPSAWARQGLPSHARKPSTTWGELDLIEPARNVCPAPWTGGRAAPNRSQAVAGRVSPVSSSDFRLDMTRGQPFVTI